MRFSIRFFPGLLAAILLVSLVSIPTCAAAAPALGLTAVQTKVTAVQGQSVSNDFTVTTGGSFSGPVTLSISGLPAAVTTTWSQSNFTPANSVSTTTSTLYFQVPSTLPANWYTYSVTASGDGLSVTWNYTLIVSQAPSISASVNLTSFTMTSMGTASLNVIAALTGGLSTTSTQTQAQIVSGLPAGVSVSYGTPMVSSGVVTYPLNFTGSAAALGSRNTLSLAVTLTDTTTGQSYSATTTSALTVVYVAPTLNFSAASTKVTSVQGGTVSNLFTFVTGGSFHGPVTLSVSGLPSGVTATWSNSSFTPATPVSTTTSTLTLSPGSTLLRTGTPIP